MVRMLVSVGLTVAAMSLTSAVVAQSDPVFTLQMRSRSETAPGSGRWHSLTQPVKWRASETAVVVCDMWDQHWCPASTRRVAELAPAMDDVLRAAREQGALIIHCPSDTLDFYKGWPQRIRAQQAPPVETDVPLQSWCHLDPQVEGPSLPIDDSDGGCDAGESVESYRAWTRQHPAIHIAEQDAITDSAEAFYLMKERGITNVIVMGVHTNMCVLGRPFSIRQMVQQGQNVVLMRDMTDTMYNPARPPFVSHFTGSDLVVEHIEQYWCPTVLSSDLTGKPELRFAADTRPHVAILCSEPEYHTEESLPPFALQELGSHARVSFVWHDEDDPNQFPGLEVIDRADVLLISVRRRTPPPEQLAAIRRFVASGRPIVGIRTANHAFCQRNRAAPEGRADWPEFDREVIGGSYTNHYGNGPLTSVTLASESVADHPLLRDVDVTSLTGHGSLYKVSPLHPGTTPLLHGAIPEESPEPVAWVYRRADGGTSFYTSLGHVKDFEQPAFRTLLKNAVLHLAESSGD